MRAVMHRAVLQCVLQVVRYHRLRRNEPSSHQAVRQLVVDHGECRCNTEEFLLGYVVFRKP